MRTKYGKFYADWRDEHGARHMKAFPTADAAQRHTREMQQQTAAKKARRTTTPPLSQTEIVFAVQESPEGGYEARALGHSIYTQAETLEQLKQSLRHAVRCHFTDADKPSVIRLHLVKDEVISA